METSNNIVINGCAFSLGRNLSAKTPGSLDRGLRGVEIAGSLKDDASGLAGPDRVRLGVDRLKGTRSRLNSAARTIRVAEETMGKIEGHIDRMKTELQTMIKNYPPFPPGSEERVKRLKSVKGLRKLIDQLTIPPPNEEFAAKIMSDHDVVSKNNDSQKMSGENKLHQTGFEGLGIPQLPESADDEEVHVFIKELDAAREMLRQMRSELAEDAAKIAEFYERKTEIGGIYPSYGEEIKYADRKTEAERKSHELGFELAMVPGMTLTEAQTQLLSLLN